MNVSRLCANIACKRSIAHKRPQAIWCDIKCANTGWHQRRRVAAQKWRPRCMICGNPIRYGRPGVRLSSTTCGKRTCAIRRYNWFGKAVA